MYPAIYPPVAASSACVALLRAAGGPVRFYQFGLAPQNVAKPYAVWQRVSGFPENYLGDLPDVDSFTIQVDAYASSADQVRTVAAALRDALEPVAHITSWLGESIDPDTKSNRYSFQLDFWTARS